LQLAAPLLQERQLSAYFFITSQFIGQRPHFMSADELRELSQLPGMCIGSHGMTHRFFDDMPVDESLAELTGSRQAIEAICGSACRSISFPGGRFSLSTLEQLAASGYTQWFGSEIGVVNASAFQGKSELITPSINRDSHYQQALVGIVKPQAPVQALTDRWQLGRQCDPQPLERVAIRCSTQEDEFRRIISCDPAWFRRKHFNSQVKQITRRVLGNRLYHGLYKSISAR